MKYYLYKFSDNWADEMDLEGFAILTEKEKDSKLAYIKKKFKKGGTISFGTNEDNEYDSLSDVLDCIEFKEISQADYNAVKRIFGDKSMGELGPLNYENDDFYDEENECENCGCYLDEDDDEMCDDCKREETEEFNYNTHAAYIRDFIKNEYGLIETPDSNYHSKFIWKPTPKTEIEITISEFERGDEEVEITLRLGKRELDYNSFDVIKVYDNPSRYIREEVKKVIEKAKKY